MKDLRLETVTVTMNLTGWNERPRWSNSTMRPRSFIIGADGGWGRVRTFLRSGLYTALPDYSGLQYATVMVRDVPQRFPHLAGRIGTGMFFVLKKRHGNLSVQDFKNTLLGDAADFSGWWPEAKQLIAAGLDDEMADCAPVNVKPMYKLPLGYSWPTEARAMMLSDVLVAAVEETDKGDLLTTVKEPLAKFEAGVITRAKGKAVLTDENCGLMFGDDAARRLAAFMKSFMPPDD
ncbi:monooxygenase [Ophiostoma piceae UAMH 11346]|uniref:Monooxygenase n=1 Tax=Ophiostoma piceae (strain UAMH 11346) TaxID=1262450 RepID=S3C3H1_OPHP1|nr:monooxygenase [Ophiostoma piceae UAMH 11346]